MNKILSRILGFLKYLLFVGAFLFVLLGILLTHRRLEKEITEALPILLPFALLLITYIFNLFIKSKVIKDNLLFNFTSVVVFAVIIIIGVRAKFDTSMLLYHKYQIDFNPQYFADNLLTIQLLIYSLFTANVIYLISTFFEDKPKKVRETDHYPKEEVEVDQDDDPTLTNIQIPLNKTP